MRRVPILKVMALTLMPIFMLTACTQSQSQSEKVITQSDVSNVSVTPIEKLTDARIVALANGASLG